jgi:hypothetical protein
MTPRRLDHAVIHERLREIQLLLADLVEVGEVDAGRLSLPDGSAGLGPGCPQARVRSVAVGEFGVWAGFDHAPGVEHHDAVGGGGLGQPVGHDE